MCNAADPSAIAERVVTRGLSVRAVEDLIKREAEQQEEADGYARISRKPKDADTRALERRLTDRIGLAVDINHKGDGGEVKLKYASLEQLDKIVALLGA